MSKDDERVLCFPRTAVRENIWDYSFMDVGILSIVPRQVMILLPRRLAEGDPRFKQVVTYCIVRVGSGRDARFLSYSRFKSGDESRLHDRRSIGVGGHAGGGFASLGGGESLDSFLDSEMAREIAEEISIDRIYDLGRIGIVNFDGDKVGRDHIGLVYLLSAPGDTSIIAIEDCLADVRMLSAKELEFQVSEYEEWSKILIENYIRNIQS